MLGDFVVRHFEQQRNRIAFSALQIVFILLAFGLEAATADNPSLAIVNGGIEQTEDAPFASPDYEFLPGDYLYFTFEIAGYATRSTDRDETRKMSLAYSVVPEDAAGTPLTPESSGNIQADLTAEDKHWTPKRRASFLIPSFVAAGEHRIHLHVRDLIGNSEISQDFPFRIGGVAVQPANSITIQNFHFFRRENDRDPLEVAAYSPGDTVFARFDMTGFKTAAQNEYHVSYGLIVLGPDGKPFINKSSAAELQSNSFYPARYVPGVIDLKTSPQMAHGEYVIVLTAHDALGNTSSDIKRAFSIE